MVSYLNSFQGTSGNDSLEGTNDNDQIIGYAGDDALSGKLGEDQLQGGDGNDTLHGGDGADQLFGGNGNDLLIGGADHDLLTGNGGDDTLQGGTGNDTLRYVLSQNSGATDDYSGNLGVDTLQLEFTQEEWDRDDIRQEVLSYARFLAAGDSTEFSFTSFGLTVRNFEMVRVKVAGVVTPQPLNDQLLSDPSLTDEDTPYTFTLAQLLGSDSDPDGTAGVITSFVTTSDYGAVLTRNADGSITYDPTRSAAIDALEAGDALTDTFRYTVTYEDGSTAIAALRLNVTGAEQPPEQRGELSPQVADIAGDYSYTLPERLFVDHDAGGAITYDVTLQGGAPLPDFLVFDPDTRTLSFAETPPQADDAWRYGLEVTATEEDGQTSTASFTLTLTDSAPILAASVYSKTQGTDEGEVINALGNGSWLYGNGGADVLRGGRSKDYLRGGAGDDVLFGNNGTDTLHGDEGNDNLYGGNGNDTLSQGEGIGILDGGDGKDYIVASSDKNAAILSETLIGGEGNDRILDVGSHSSDIVDAGAGYDMVYLSHEGGSEDDPVTSVVTLGTEADILVLHSSGEISSYHHTIVTDFNVSEDFLHLREFADIQLVGWDKTSNPFSAGFLQLVDDPNGNAVLSIDLDGGGDSFAPAITFQGVSARHITTAHLDLDFAPDGSTPEGLVITGTSQKEILSGGTGSDTILGNKGDDNLSGDYGDDSIDGGADNDQISGDGGNDILRGGLGNDRLSGDQGDDNLYGGEGDDTLSQGKGSGLLDGGEGNDRLVAAQQMSRLSLSETLIGGNGDDLFVNIGYGSSDRVDAGAGSDEVWIKLRGGMADNPLRSVVTLGAGEDTLWIDRNSKLNKYNDILVTDFDPTQDQVGIESFLLYSNLLKGLGFGDSPIEEGYLRLINDGAGNAVLQIDRNGGGDGFQDFITFQGLDASSLTSENFDIGWPLDGSPWIGNTIDGTSTADRLSGSYGNDTLLGLNGKDTLSGSYGDDSLNGGAGHDNLYGGAGDDTLIGEAGNDELYQGSGTGLLNGGLGNDTLFASSENNGPGASETLIGGAGDDVIDDVGAYSSDIVDAGAGDDTVYLYLAANSEDGTLSSTVTLGDGADTVSLDLYPRKNLANHHVTFTDFNVAEDRLRLSGFLNQDINGWDGSTNPFDGYVRFVDDGAGNALFQVDKNGGGDAYTTLLTFQNVSAASFDETIVLTDWSMTGAAPEAQIITGTDTSYEILKGGKGSDTISGMDGIDRILGGNGRDQLDGGAGNDALYGDAGRDRMFGGAGADAMFGGRHNDTLFGQNGNDILRQGAGGGQLNGGAGDDILYPSLSFGGPETLIGGAGNDEIYDVGYRSSDIVDAGAGDDYVQLKQRSGTEANPLQSTITLGEGADTLSVIVEKSDSIYNTSRITDFDPSEDRIRFVIPTLWQPNYDHKENPFTNGRFRFVDDGAGNALFQIDKNGGGDNFQTSIIFEGISAREFTSANVAGWYTDCAPDGDTGHGSLVIGTLGDDLLAGTGQNDQLQGHAGDDTIFGAEGRDTIFGGDGDDRIEGGLGFDELTGGLGADRFVFAAFAGTDDILDFEVGVDMLELSGDLSIISMTEIDTDGIDGVDSTLVQLSSTASVTLIDVLGLSDPIVLI